MRNWGKGLKKKHKQQGCSEVKVSTTCSWRVLPVLVGVGAYLERTHALLRREKASGVCYLYRSGYGGLELPSSEHLVWSRSRCASPHLIFTSTYLWANSSFSNDETAWLNNLSGVTGRRTGIKPPHTSSIVLKHRAVLSQGLDYHGSRSKKEERIGLEFTL